MSVPCRAQPRCLVTLDDVTVKLDEREKKGVKCVNECMQGVVVTSCFAVEHKPRFRGSCDVLVATVTVDHHGSLSFSFACLLFRK